MIQLRGQELLKCKKIPMQCNVVPAHVVAGKNFILLKDFIFCKDCKKRGMEINDGKTNKQVNTLNAAQ